MDKIKVIQFIPNMSTGGAETLIKEYVLNMAQKVENVIVIIPRLNGYINEKIVLKNNVRILSILEEVGMYKVKNIIRRIFFKMNNKALEKEIQKGLVKIIKKEKPDCIHIHLQQLKYFENIEEEVKGIRLIYTCHNLPQNMFGKGHEREFEIAQKMLKNQKLQIIALHSKMADELNRIFGITNVKVVKNAIDFKRFKMQKNNVEDIKEKLSIPKNTFIVGHVGRFAKEKNHEFLIEVFGKMHEKNKDIFLLLIGNGPEKNNIINILNKKQLEDKYLILENREDIPDLMSIMDILIFPSLFEGFGNVLLEAQIVGLKCLISDTIPESVLLTKNIIPLSLKETPQKWSEMAFDKNVKNENITGDLNDYNIDNQTKILEKIYRGD